MAELKKMYCPSCGGELTLDTGRLTTGKVITCPYCGNQYAYVDPNEKVTTSNINIDQKVTVNSASSSVSRTEIKEDRRIDDSAAVQREIEKGKLAKSLMGHVIRIVVVLIILRLLFGPAIFW